MSDPVRDDNVLLKDVKGEEAFRLLDGSVITNLEQLYLRFKGMDAAVFSHHVNSQKNDFGNWIKDVYKDERLANELFLATDKGSCAKAVARRILELKNKVNVSNKVKSEKAVNNKNADSFKTIPENVSAGFGFLDKTFYEKKSTTLPAIIPASVISSASVQTPAMAITTSVPAIVPTARNKQNLYKGETPAQILERILSQAASAKIQQTITHKRTAEKLKKQTIESKYMHFDFLEKEFYADKGEEGRNKKEEEEINRTEINRTDIKNSEKEREVEERERSQGNRTYVRRNFGRAAEPDTSEPLFHFDLQAFSSSQNTFSQKGHAIEEILAESDTKAQQYCKKQTNNGSEQQSSNNSKQAAEVINEKEFELKEFEDTEGTEESNPSLRLTENENACHEMLKVVNSGVSPMQLFEGLSAVFGRSKGNNSDKNKNTQATREKTEAAKTLDEKNESKPRNTAGLKSSNTAIKKGKMLEHLKKVYK
jgi:hypothetical protein